MRDKQPGSRATSAAPPTAATYAAQGARARTPGCQPGTPAWLLPGWPSAGTPAQLCAPPTPAPSSAGSRHRLRGKQPIAFSGPKDGIVH
eukprot:5774635-Alexandrium_andersonii.AAC.1